MKILNTDYFIKNIYSLNSELTFQTKIPINVNSRNITFKMFQDFHLLLNENLFSINQGENNQLTLFIDYDDKIQNDGYYLDINAKRNIIIKASSSRGIRYAISTLNKMVEEKNGEYRIPISLIEDEPAFKYRGIIEGYYGEPWTYEERLDMVSFMDEFRLNTYMYAPKTDIYHREKWYELYPDDEFHKLKSLKNELNNKEIDFYYCISPGHAKVKTESFKYVGEDDFNRLFTKLKQISRLGVKHFGLLLDDIDYKLSGENKEIFFRPGIAHAHICNKVNKFLKENVIDSTLVMCPTEYHQVGASEYRNDLKNNLDQNIIVFWTGDNVCAEVITEEHVRETKLAFDKDLFIWDNFPVSDFTYGVREFIAPIKNRTVNLGQYASGYMINPSIHYEISKVGMITMAHYSWNSAKYDFEKSFAIALKYIGDDFYTKALDYINFNYPNVLSYGNLKYEKELVENKQYDKIIQYYHLAATSAQKLLELEYLIINELSPWLNRVIKEEQIVKKIINEELPVDELILFLEDIKFSGCEILDYLILDKKLLSDDEYMSLIKKRRGPQWYRVFEEKRWQKR